MNHEVFDLCSW